MLMHSSMLPSFQIGVKNLLRMNRSATQTGTRVCITLSEFSQMTCPLYNLTDSGQYTVSIVLMWTLSKVTVCHYFFHDLDLVLPASTIIPFLLNTNVNHGPVT